MLKVELEERLGFEITNEGFEELEKMYMASSLNKDEFAKLVKSGAKEYKVERPIRKITFGDPYHKTPNGCWYIGVKKAELVDINIRTGKVIVRNAKELVDYGMCSARPDYDVKDVVVMK